LHINPMGGYLRDTTGARRFWPVTCGLIDLEALVRDRDQLWAEAVVRFQAGARWWLEMPEPEGMAAAEQQARLAVDAWEEKVSKWLAGRGDVSVGEVLVGALGLPPESWSQSAQTESLPSSSPTGSSNTDRAKRDNREHRVTADMPIIRSISPRSSLTKRSLRRP
jgi:hypothetical protein